MLININKKPYHVNDNEFNVITHEEYNNLRILNGLGELERICSLLSELSVLEINNIIIHNTTHGGFIPINLAKKYTNVYLLNTSFTHKENIEKNARYYNISNIKWELDDTIKNCVVYTPDIEFIDTDFINTYNPFIVAPNSLSTMVSEKYNTILPLSDTHISLYIPIKYTSIFYDNFGYYVKITNNKTVLHYDNLIHLCIMVKNGGPQFEQMLHDNMHLIDRWTILDTGSTDDTVNIIKRTLVNQKKGELYEEPFINFRDSRNRLLELAGETCKYTLMLDDTYVIKGDLRKFLHVTRGDQFADSFTLYIKSDDVEYGSNRILKTDRHLKYLYKIHEVIQEANNKIFGDNYICLHTFLPYVC